MLETARRLDLPNFPPKSRAVAKLALRTCVRSARFEYNGNQNLALQPEIPPRMLDAPLTSASLLIRLRDGRDHEAWQQFVELYSAVVYGFARKRGLQDADAADVMQDVLRSVAGAAGRLNYDPRAAPSGAGSIPSLATKSSTSSKPAGIGSVGAAATRVSARGSRRSPSRSRDWPSRGTRSTSATSPPSPCGAFRPR